MHSTYEGDDLLATDYERAAAAYHAAIENDTTEFYSGGARIRLISVEARRILASLEELSSDSGVRGRVLRQLVATEPLRQVMDVWRPNDPINGSPARLTEIRDAILDSYVAAGDIPVTNSELDCAMGKAPKGSHLREVGSRMLPTPDATSPFSPSSPIELSYISSAITR